MNCELFVEHKTTTEEKFDKLDYIHNLFHQKCLQTIFAHCIPVPRPILIIRTTDMRFKCCQHSCKVVSLIVLYIFQVNIFTINGIQFILSKKVHTKTESYQVYRQLSP